MPDFRHQYDGLKHFRDVGIYSYRCVSFCGAAVSGSGVLEISRAEKSLFHIEERLLWQLFCSKQL